MVVSQTPSRPLFHPAESKAKTLRAVFFGPQLPARTEVLAEELGAPTAVVFLRSRSKAPVVETPEDGIDGQHYRRAPRGQDTLTTALKGLS